MTLNNHTPLYIIHINIIFFVQAEAHRTPYTGGGEKGLGKGQRALQGFKPVRIKLVHSQIMSRNLTN